MEKFGTAFPQFVEPAGNHLFEFLPARPIGMLSEQLTGELEPDLLHRIGRGERRWAKAASESGCFWPPSDRSHSHGNAPANYRGAMEITSASGYCFSTKEKKRYIS